MAKPPVRPVDEWDFPNPAELQEQVRRAVAEFAPEADLDAMTVVLNLFRVAGRIQQDLETTVHRPSGLTWAAFRLLITIRHAGPLSPLELARLFSVAQSSISSVVNTLERYGLIVREASPEDGRSVLITLTEAGEAVAAELFRRQNRREREWTRALSRRERETFVRLLLKLLEHRPALPYELAERLPELEAFARAEASR